MSTIKIISAGLLTTIQDGGRDNLAYYAVPKGGVVDVFSARVAWSLLQQDETFPIMECTAIAPTLQFSDNIRIAISGADFDWQLNDAPVQLNQVLQVRAGDILKGGRALNGLRGYIAFSAELNLQQVYESYSTSSNAQVGQILRKADEIEFKAQESNAQTIILKKGPEFDYLTESGRQSLFQTVYSVGTDSNRMGIRLKGESIETMPKKLTHSVPVLPGFMQIPPSGQPIILMQDGQTTGGYPRVAYLHEKEMAKLSQVPLRGKVFFCLKNKDD